jgi:cell wall-associated NlpC family hydrolase
MKGVEINIAPSSAVQKHILIGNVRRLSVKVRAVRMFATAFSGLAIAAASAHATGLDLEQNHIATGAVEFGEPGAEEGGAASDVMFSSQELLADNPLVSALIAKTTLADVLEKAETMIGTPYLWGGNTPETGLDCSGFVRYVYEKAAGILLPRLSAQISRKGLAIAQTDLHPGDLVFFNTPRGQATHVGIYVGENQFIHAPKKGAFVRIESMKSAYWTSRYYGARRVMA